MSAKSANDEFSTPDSATVLVVDDESSVRDLMTRWLIAEGYHCVQAASAQEACEHLRTRRYLVKK